MPQCPLEVGPHGPFSSFSLLAFPEKPEPPRNGIKNRALLCFEVPVASGPGPQERKKKTKGRGGPLRVGIAAFTYARHTAPYHPQPTGGLCQGPCGSGGHCRGRGLPQGHHNGPEEATAGPRHTSSALPRPRPVGHQSAPWPHQTPTKHPREVPTCPLGLGRPLGHCRGAGDGKNCAVSLPSSGWMCREKRDNNTLP